MFCSSFSQLQGYRYQEINVFSIFRLSLVRGDNCGFKGHTVVTKILSYSHYVYIIFKITVSKTINYMLVYIYFVYEIWNSTQSKAHLSLYSSDIEFKTVQSTLIVIVKNSRMSICHIFANIYHKILILPVSSIEENIPRWMKHYVGHFIWNIKDIGI